MKKFCLLLIFFIPINVMAVTYPDIYSDYVYIYDASDNKVLYEKNSNEITSIASLTKIATTITAIENIDDINTKVTITSEMLSTVDPIASIAGLKVGDVLSYEDLLYASMLPSGADATNSLAILTSGSIEEFVNKMNELAERIGLSNTHFVNVTGLDTDGHYSTASDVEKLLYYALNNELFKKIYTTREYVMSNGNEVHSTLYLYNKNINGDLSNIVGSKTGFTRNAGYCIATLNEYNEHSIIMVFLNAPYEEGIAYHLMDDFNIYNFIKDNYDNQLLLSKSTIVKNIPVNYGNIDEYNISLSEDIYYFLPNDFDIDKFKYEYKGIDELSYKNIKGEYLGEVNFYYDNELIYIETVILDQDIKFDIFKFIINYIYVPIILISIIILLLIFRVIIIKK